MNKSKLTMIISAYKVMISDLIYEARIQKGKTQKELADLVGMKQHAISRLESGQHMPDIETLIKIAVVLGGSLILPRFSFIKNSFTDHISTPFSFQEWKVASHTLNSAEKPLLLHKELTPLSMTELRESVKSSSNQILV